jgi:polyketide synthase PksN
MMTTNRTSPKLCSRAQRRELDDWCARLLHTQLRQTDLTDVPRKYHRLLNTFQSIADPRQPGQNDEQIWRQWRDYRGGLQHRELQAAAHLVSCALEPLPQILKGKVLATDALFPKGSFANVEALYSGNPFSDFFNTRLAELAEAFVRSRTEKLRILEIGAGTGATTAKVVQRLRPLIAYEDSPIEEYCFSDLSQAFLINARSQYADRFPAMRYCIFDIQQPPRQQRIAHSHYDLVIATNVLHATCNIRQTLQNTKALLKQGGLLLINEIVEKSVVGTVTFGLTDDWWRYDDSELRIPDSPLLDIAHWRLALEEAGFCYVSAVTDMWAELGQEVIAAESDGLILVVSQPPVTATATPPKVLDAAEQAPAQWIDTQLRAQSAHTTEAVLTELLHQILEDHQVSIEPQVPFAEYGIDSILGVALVERINEQFGCDLNPTILFEQSTPQKLSRYLDGRFAQEALAVRATTAKEEIAVVGMSGRFPAAANIDALWENLCHKGYVVGALPKRFSTVEDGYSWGALLEDRDDFDPLFFNISPREAESMNRHQRLVLQEGWKAIESAGYAPRALAETATAVFVGAEAGSVQEVGESFSGASQAIVASRLSYILGLHGPAMVVNTGCSSSAVALHLACRALRDGEADFALAAGVSAETTPEMLASLARAGMLSPSGCCRSFDERADGTVLSEGVAVVVLKRLSDAIADNDTIHGVIVASGVNQDGASNGITAPSGHAQEALITQLYRHHGIDPEQISYVEAHGTGTKLGDPVEANALIRAFSHFTQQRNYCGISSIKAHIGHTSASSGIIGLIKLLLCLRHRYLPGLPDFQTLNPRIKLQDSPFYILARGRPWEEAGKPLMAALSAFGHSGTNAHFVVRAQRRPSSEPQTAMLQRIPLSARNEQQLRGVAAHLSAFVQNNPEIALRELAWTLQIGREAMAHRIAFSVTTPEELVKALNAYLEGTLSPPTDPIAQRWCEGETIAWESLHQGCTPRRVMLPTYPFAQQTYPLPKLGEARMLHPLVQRNCSDLRGVRFCSYFDGEEFFLADHRVNDQCLLPGVAYLEMARAALALAASAPPWQLQEVSWERPFWVDGGSSIEVALSQKDEASIAYRIYSIDKQGAEVVHGRGRALSAKTNNTPPPPRLALQTLLKRIGNDGPGLADCQRAFRSLGVVYGASFRAIDTLYATADEVLAKITLPNCVQRGRARYLLHPALLDAALQSAMALTLIAHQGQLPKHPALPFALERLVITPLGVEKLAQHDLLWAWVRCCAQSSTNTVVLLDVDLCDEQGAVMLQLRGLSSRPLHQRTCSAAVDDEALHALVPSWNPVVVRPEPIDRDEAVMVVGGDGAFRRAVADCYPKARELAFCDLNGDLQLCISRPLRHLLWLAPEPEHDAHRNVHPNKVTSPDEALDQDQALIEAQELGVIALLRLIKALIRHGYELEDLRWTVVTTQCSRVSEDDPKGMRPAHAAVHGLVGTMAKEFPHWRVRLLDLPRGWEQNPVPLMPALFSQPFDTAGDPVAWRNNTWLRRSLTPVMIPELDQHPMCYRQGGCYVVVGGAGGIGRVWSRAVMQAFGAQLVWIGRRLQDPAISAAMEALTQQTGAPSPCYLQADATDQQALEQAFAEVERRFGVIHGVVHSAIVLDDHGLTHMSEEAFRAGLKPKVAASVCLGRICRRLDRDGALDFLIFFSSLQAFSTAAGQSNYAAGSCFADSYAWHLQHTLSCKVKVVNWGYWGHVGIVSDEANRRRMAMAGLGSIEPREGMTALAHHLEGPDTQWILLKQTAPPHACSSERAPPSETATPSESQGVKVYPHTIPSGIEMLAHSANPTI